MLATAANPGPEPIGPRVKALCCRGQRLVLTAMADAERIDWLFALAQRHAQDYASPEAWLARQRYLARHPTAILVMKCMDGRINIPIATQTPKGIIQPFRNLGGIFKLGWPHLGETLTAAMDKVVRNGRQALMMITYHYSQGDERRGCAGFHYRTGDARAHTFEIQREVSVLFGATHGTVYPLVCGFETDEDAIVVHGSHGQTLNMAELSEADLETLPARLLQQLPDMPTQMRADLLPLAARFLAPTATYALLDELSEPKLRWYVRRNFTLIRDTAVAASLGDDALPLNAMQAFVSWKVSTSDVRPDRSLDRTSAGVGSDTTSDLASSPEIQQLLATVRKLTAEVHVLKDERAMAPDDDEDRTAGGRRLLLLPEVIELLPKDPVREELTKQTLASIHQC